MATAPGGVARLRELILTLAVQGKLVPQDPADEPASALLQKIRAEKDRLIAEGKSKRDKPLAEIAEEEKPFALPQGWEWVRFGDVALISSGVTLGRKTAIPSPIMLPYLRVANVQRWHVNLTAIKEVVIDRTELARFQLVNGDLLITEGGDWDKVGRTAIWRDELPTCLHQNHVFKVRGTSPEWSPLWAQLFLNSPVARAYFAFSAKQTTNLASINMTELKHCVFPLPPLAEQSRIVTRVDALMRLCDALEAKGRLEAAQHAQLVSTLLGALTASTTPEELAENWQRVAQHFDLLAGRPEAIDALEQTLLQLAVRGLLVPQDPTDEPASVLLKKIRAEKDRLIAAGQIKRDKPLPPITDEEKPFALPVGWEWVRFGDASINRDGERIPVSSSDRENRAKTYDYYGASGVIDKIDGFLFDKTLLLIGEDGANLINRSTPIAFLAHGKYWVNNHAHVIDTTHPELMTYLALFINAISLEPYVTGTAQPKMNQAKLNSIVIGLPPLPEQTRIVTRVTALRRLCADLRQRLAEREAVQARLAEALVHEVSLA
ncbi:restriction endonuclease subunit S [Acidovorax carolinensis]|uniref:restriction endonuclease subunit S n=1 Tax=Acidovorax carolinensis TaxID=553814 RepID=UPI001ABFC64C|nr:restriction endonuclease subunit S [Acidovorax carolinensis]